jgi:predicted RecA/RadA family phage recombinase
MKNQVFQGTPTSPRFCICPSTVHAGDLVLIGSEPACALNDYQANSGGATFYFSGTFTGTVVGSSTHSPYTGEAINYGDKLYASGTLDTATNVTTGLLISGTTTDTPFGWLDPTGPVVPSGQTVTNANVRLSVG